MLPVILFIVSGAPGLAPLEQAPKPKPGDRYKGQQEEQNGEPHTENPAVSTTHFAGLRRLGFRLGYGWDTSADHMDNQQNKTH